MRRDTLREFGYRLRLTKNEQNVLFFLCAAILLGAGVTGFGAIFGSGAPPGGAFSYGAMDREFFDGARQYAAASAASPGTAMDTAAAAPSTTRGSKKGLPGRAININTAAEEELRTLPGVGPSTAEKIVAYRRAHGAFRRIEEVMKVSSIGEKKFLRMKPYISVK